MTTAPASAQRRWKEIGKTSVGNFVYVDPASVRTVSGVITGRIRVKFIEPGKTPERVCVASLTIGGSMTQVALDSMCKKNLLTGPMVK